VAAYRKLAELVCSDQADAAEYEGTWCVRTSLLQSIPLRSSGRGWQIELPIKLAQRHSRIRRLPIGSGKKASPRWGFWTAWRTRLFLDNYTDPAAAMLGKMARAKRFNRWMAETIRPFIKGHVLEIGAGIGNMTELLCGSCERYVATDTAGEHLRELAARLTDAPGLTIEVCDAADPEHYRTFTGTFDTVICLNVLEHIPDDRATLLNIRSALRPGGRAIILVPQGPHAFGTLDRVLWHRRRYSKAELESKMHEAVFRVEQIIEFNRVTYPGWILNSRILRRRTLSGTQLRLVDLLVPFWKKIDARLPWPPTSLIAIGMKDR
jgi:2-polyprenyl-3-methyl-5-hydroxy-6-metoxy-1,4-benzoquinol methylase